MTRTSRTPALARLIVKLQGCELNHQLAALAIDALGELGMLYERRRRTCATRRDLAASTTCSTSA